MFNGDQLRLGASGAAPSLMINDIEIVSPVKMGSFSLFSLLPASIFVVAGTGHNYQGVLVLKIIMSSGYFFRPLFNPLLLPLNKQNKVMCLGKYLQHL